MSNQKIITLTFDFQLVMNLDNFRLICLEEIEVWAVMSKQSSKN